jgi:hypothetical protein
MNDATNRWTSVDLPEALINEVASKLKIKDRSRIPRRLVVSAAAAGYAKDLGLRKESPAAHVLIVP